jgi:hypothetical protein
VDVKTSKDVFEIRETRIGSGNKGPEVGVLDGFGGICH